LTESILVMDLEATCGENAPFDMETIEVGAVWITGDGTAASHPADWRSARARTSAAVAIGNAMNSRSGISRNDRPNGR